VWIAALTMPCGEVASLTARSEKRSEKRQEANENKCVLFTRKSRYKYTLAPQTHKLNRCWHRLVGRSASSAAYVVRE
jgi:hypothetical protein